LKFKEGFVSNSSSVSFIIAPKNKNSIIKIKGPKTLDLQELKTMDELKNVIFSDHDIRDDRKLMIIDSRFYNQFSEAEKFIRDKKEIYYSYYQDNWNYYDYIQCDVDTIIIYECRH
jgi:hypothetical protein